MSEENSNEKRELDVQTLVDQLKDSTKVARDVQSEKFSLAKEDLEQFILDHTGQLITDSMDTISDIKQYIINGPEADDVHSLAELYKASTSALEALNKILIQQQKSATQVAVKKMDIDSKNQLATKRADGEITFTRDEVFNELIKSGSIIDATPIEPADVEDDL